MEYKITISKDKIAKVLLTTINSALSLNMHELEIDILATLLNKGLTIVDAKSRTIIRTTLNKDKFTTNNYIKKLKDKGLLFPTDNVRELKINPTLIMAIKNKEHHFTFDKID